MTGPEQRNIVLLCLDSVREDVFREWASRLSGRADILYTQCRATSGWSVPSHASMFTGKLPYEHGIHVYNRDFSGLKRSETLLGELSEYYAVGVSANAYATSTFGFDGIFDDYIDISPHRRFPNGIDVMQFGQTHDKSGLSKHIEFVKRSLAHDHPIQSLGNGAFRLVDEWLAAAPIPKLFDDGGKIVGKQLRRAIADAQEPYFAFANFMDAHGPHHPVYGYNNDQHDASLDWSSATYSSHEVNSAEDLSEYEEDLRLTRQVYGASVEYLDRLVNGLIDDISAESERPTTIVVTADHGENLGTPVDRGLVAHKGSLTEGLLHVPLAIYNAPSTPYREVNNYVSHTSLRTLLVGLASGTVPDITVAHPLAERVGSNLPDHVDRDSDEGRYWDRAIRVVYDDDRKWQYNSLGDRQAYQLDSDRPNWQSAIDEDFDVQEIDETYFDIPISDYDRQAREMERTPRVDTATEQRLTELGYR